MEKRLLARRNFMDLCVHLETILEEELKSGNKVIREYENEWQNEAFSVRLKKPLNKKKQENYLSLSPSISYWENKDSNFMPGKGYYCKECKHSISGPMYLHP
jgi:hypothetical protein